MTRKVKKAKKTRVTKAPADSADLRFQDTVPLKKFRSKRIGIAGLGAVGRHVAILLGVMGHKNLFGADPDKIELKNIGSQGWKVKDIGRTKAQTLTSEITVVSDRAVMTAFPAKFEAQANWIKTLDIFFCCVDTMSARKAIWDIVKERDNLQGLWLDSRMASRVIRVITVDLSSQIDRDYYEKTLFTDAEGFEGSCTDRMTVYGAYIAAGLLVSQMTNWLNDMLIKKDVVLETLALSMNDLQQEAGQ
ncbi:hypothetical protein LCGC14_1416680 [marine sediment metagenome]|uniref:THIF-type NAD/FAD binding fold domain-containing protein n=1 Tax=marine sediment metagenome TaxID=412755 RepID=A0A0F9MUD8_9ZZZZ